MPLLEKVLLDLSQRGQALSEHLVEGKRPQEAAQVFDNLWQLIGRASDTEAVITGTSVACWKAIDVAVEAGDIDLALRIHAQLFQASKNRPDDLFLREAAMGSRACIVAGCTRHGRLDTALTLYEELRIMLQDSVSSGKEADRNKILYACFCLAYGQQQAGSCYEAKETVTRALSMMPLSESLAYLHETFGLKEVDSLLRQLGVAYPNTEDVDRN